MISDIREKIRNKLGDIEREENVRILFCAESGSRAWGFASPDSDYDARFVYVRPAEYYLKLGKTRDVIEWQLDDVYDINGWDIQKYLRLMFSSNASVFEWSNSPDVYLRREEWESVSALLPQYFSPRAALGHYLGLARGNYERNLTEERVKLKKYFYSLRPVLCAEWITDRGTPPPVPFSQLLDAELDPALAGEVERLMEMKAAASESELSGHIPALDEYICSKLAELSAKAESIAPAGQKDWQPLDDLFLRLIGFRDNL